MNGIYIKDLSIVNRDLKDLILIDNNPISYALHVDNGLPIKSWYDDETDLELTNLLPILEFLAYTKDIRKYMNRFVINNNISYQEAFNLICMANTNNNNDSELEICLTDGKKQSERADSRKNTNSNGTNLKTQESEDGVTNNNKNNAATSPPFPEKSNNRNIVDKQRENTSAKTDKNININIINNHINNYIINKNENQLTTTTSRDQGLKGGLLNSFRTNFPEDNYRKNVVTNLNTSINKDKNIFNKLPPTSNKSQTNRGKVNLITNSIFGSTHFTPFISNIKL